MFTVNPTPWNGYVSKVAFLCWQVGNQKPETWKEYVVACNINERDENLIEYLFREFQRG